MTTTIIQAPPEVAHHKVLPIVIGLMLGMLLSGLDQTIVASASRTIGDDLGGLDQLAWLTTAFLITSTLTTLLYGKLSDLFGRKRLYLTAISLFLLGSTLSGLAWSVPALAAFRAVQGLGAGGLMTLAFAITADVIPPRERANYQGYFTATMAISSVLGPLVGGFFAGLPTFLGVVGWRWAFWVNVPIGLAALVVLSRVLPADKPGRQSRVDWAGAALLALGLAPLLVIGQEGLAWGWTSSRALACYLVGAVGVIGFVWRQSQLGDKGILPLGLLRRRTFAMPVLVTFVIGAAQFGGIVLVPLYLQIVRGTTPTLAGVMLIPMVLGMALTSLGVGKLIKKTGRTKIFPVLGMAVLTSGFIGLSTLGADTALPIVDVWMLIIGIGLGACANPIMLMLQGSVTPSQFGVASASGTFFRNIGATAGTACLMTALFSRASGAITADYQAAATTGSAFTAAATAHPDQMTALRDGLRGGLSDTGFLARLDPALSRPFLDGFSTAMDHVALIAAALAAAGFVLTLLLHEKPLATTAGSTPSASH